MTSIVSKVKGTQQKEQNSGKIAKTFFCRTWKVWIFQYFSLFPVLKELQKFCNVIFYGKTWQQIRQSWKTHFCTLKIFYKYFFGANWELNLRSPSKFWSISDCTHRSSVVHGAVRNLTKRTYTSTMAVKRFLSDAKCLFRRNPLRWRADETCLFRWHFEVCPMTTSKIWKLLRTTRPPSSKPKRLLWALFKLKTYLPNSVCATYASASRDTFRKRAWILSCCFLNFMRYNSYFHFVYKFF